MDYDANLSGDVFEEYLVRFNIVIKERQLSFKWHFKLCIYNALA